MKGNFVEVGTKCYSLLVEDVVDLDTAMVWLDQCEVPLVVMSRDGIPETFVLEFYPPALSEDSPKPEAQELRMGDVLVYDLASEQFKSATRADFATEYGDLYDK